MNLPLKLSLLAAACLATAPGAPDAAYPEGEADRQFAMLAHDLRHRDSFARKAAETFRPEALILAEDRDPLDVVLRRSAALLARIRVLRGAPDLSGEDRRLAALRAEAGVVPADEAAARRSLFDRVLALRRRIAFANPLLDFKELVFLRRHRALYEHMCDQYYGMAARPGGALCILSDPFGPAPAVRDVLADAVVRNGRLKGRKLGGGPDRAWKLTYDGEGNLHGEESQGGSFLSPDLSYDGKSILFAYVEGEGDRRHRHHTDPSRGHWAEGRCYHVFKVDTDGSGLVQLTDGTWNDFDPCWLPNGRIAFISERRGGYLRCGRTCPTYTLYDMAADGSDIRCLSYHETNEWNPAVANDGMILYTRWDYVDRHGCTAHQPWVVTPDGRDPRAVHGNFALRSARPDMELDLQAIPGSRRIVSTAAPHHGQGFGSLVVIDPDVPDDDRMAPVRRLTPDVDFPETQGGTQSYAQPWPLDEDFHLCAFDPAMHVPGLEGKGRYGIYLVDSFGNKELVYRDPRIACQSPIPLRPRPVPPVVPGFSARLPEDQPAEGTVSVMNVYDTQRPWPEGTKIAALRVFQGLPMSVPSGAPPHDTGMRIATAGDSVTMVRYLLGTVPVEADGSAHFVVPARRELFFQAVDEQGFAVQSMRSATQLMPGERQTCQGCHSRRDEAPAAPKVPPLALRRAPSRPVADVDGTNPFSYPRLVQPVLDRHCVKCHQENAPKAPPLDRSLVKLKRTTFFASYVSLAPKWGFWDYKDPYRTTPGKFGARAAPLTALLDQGHHGVQLPPEDRHRINVWLDSCSMFYGVYEKEGGEAQLRGEVVRPTLE